MTPASAQGSPRPLLHDTRHHPDPASHDVADTAFWVNVDRARRVDLSRDIYAHLWVTPASQALWEEMARTVYPYSDISVSLRNRYYLEHMEAFVREFPGARVVNIAAGFTMYPYLLPGGVLFLEADYERVMVYKERKSRPWLAGGVLPPRKVVSCGVDLADPADRSALGERVASWVDRAPSFVLLEGLLYYLPLDVVADLFRMLAAILPAGSLVAFEHWPTDAGTYPVFVRFKAHMEANFGWKTHLLTLFDDEYVDALPGLRRVEMADLPEVERRYSDTRVMADRANRFPHRFKVLSVTGDG